MPEFLIYIFKVAFCAALSSIPLLLLLRISREYRGMRLLCIIIATSSFLFPILHIDISERTPPTTVYAIEEIKHQIVGGANGQAEVTYANDIWVLVEILYYVVAVALLLRSLLRIVRLHNYMRSRLLWKDTTDDGITIYCHADNCPPMSWMRSIAISEVDYNSDADMIIAHESAHIRLFHSYDKILMLLFTSILWFNPFAWLLSSSMSIIHEYEADSEVIRQGNDRRLYQLLLLRKAGGENFFPIAQTLGAMKLKQRILTMNDCNSRRLRCSFIMSLFLLPITCLEILIFSSSSLTASNYILQGTVIVNQRHVVGPVPAITGKETGLYADVKERKKEAGHTDGTESKTEEFPMIEEQSVIEPPIPLDVDQLPEYTEDMASLIRLIRKHIQTDSEEPHYISCVIGADGRMSGMQLIGGTSANIDANVIQSEAKAWIPARKNGKKVVAQITIPLQ